MKLYYGIVENNVDAEMLGRVQVRIVGLHTENRTDATQQDYMPVVDLPWAQTLQAGTVMSNESSAFTVPKNGTAVVVSFVDEEEQFPIILGSVPKIPETLPDFTTGFSDPDGVNPSSESLGVSPVSNYATGTPIPGSVTEKIADVETGVQCVDNVWNEPPTEFAPEYPENLVIQSGEQILELDNSSGKERINLEHDSGTFKEIHPDGTQVTKIQGKEYLIIEGDRNVLIKGGSNITAAGFNADSSTVMNLKAGTSMELESVTTLRVATDGTLTIEAATGTISITGLLTITASMISLN